MLVREAASWADARKELLRTMWENGASYDDIAEAFCCSIGAVNQQRKALGLVPRGSGGPAWSNEKKALLRQYWSEGDTFSEIGKKLGCSRSAAIGAAARMGLQRRLIKLPSAERVKNKTKHNTRNGVRIVKKHKRNRPFLALVPTTITPKYKSLFELGAGECRYPFGDGPFTFCALPCEGSWCSFHRTLVWTCQDETTAE